MEAQLLADAERLFPFPLEDLALDFQVMGASGVQPGCAEVMVAACRQSALAPLESLVQEAGLQLEAVEVDSIALGRMLPQGSQQGLVLLRIEAHGTTLYGWQSGRPQQRLELSLGMSTITGALPERLQALFVGEPLPDCLLVASHSPIEPGRLQSLGSRLNLPCRRVPDLAGLERVDGAMILACALALGGLRR